MRSFVAGMALLAAGTGCGASRPLPSSRETWAALVAAMARPDGAATAWAMLPPAARAATPLAEFSRRWDDARAEREAAARAGESALRSHGPVAVIDTRGRPGTLVEEPSGWRVADPGVGPSPGARTPGRAGARAALRALHDALRRRDFDAVMASLSGRLRGAVEAELSSLASSTADPDALEVPEIPRGPTRVRLPDGREVVLVWEDGQWRLDDVVGP